MKTKIIIAALVMGFFTFASVQAQEKKHDDSEHEQMKKTMYTCAMHSEIKSEKPGDCSKCGMKLTKMEHKKMAKTFSCSMHPEVKSDKEGKCPKCGMALVEKKMDMKKEGDHEHKH